MKNGIHLHSKTSYFEENLYFRIKCNLLFFLAKTGCFLIRHRLSLHNLCRAFLLSIQLSVFISIPRYKFIIFNFSQRDKQIRQLVAFWYVGKKLPFKSPNITKISPSLLSVDRIHSDFLSIFFLHRLYYKHLFIVIK